MRNKIISVVMTSYLEDDKNLRRCLKSLINQTYRWLEIIIVFEPNDINFKILKNEYSNFDNIIFIQNRIKMGFVKSLNYAIKQSSSNFIARIDSDDYCDLRRFEIQKKFLDLNPNVGVLGSNMTLIDEKGKKIGERIYKENHHEIKNSFLFKSGIAHPSVIIRKNIIKRFGTYDDNFLFAEDIELWLRFLRNKVNFHNINENLVFYQVKSFSEKRPSAHWKFNLKARIRHNFYVYNILLSSFSILAFSLICLFPNVLFDNKILNGFVNRIKSKSKI